MKSITRPSKSIIRLSSAALLAAAIPALFLYIRAHACGPFFEPEVFVPQHHPASQAQYVAGNLGIVQRTYYQAELVVAFRYLAGAPLSESEKTAYRPTPDPVYGENENWQAQHDAEEAARPISKWHVARAKFISLKTGPAISPELRIVRKTGNWSYDDSQLNCTDGAFLNAIATLDSRVQTWGPDSAELKEWIAGQDAVFANCGEPGALPSVPQPTWPKLLQQDRAYQMAAAEFYGQKYDDAIRDFEAIGRDKASPWSRWGDYLAARGVVRKASVGPSGDDPGQATFNLDLLRDAQARLLRIAATPPDPRILHAATSELHFVQVRLDPSHRLDDAANALAGPHPDPDFLQDLTDLDFLLDRGHSGKSDLVQWIRAMQGSTPPPTESAAIPAHDETVGASAASLWRQKQNLPWLIAALTSAADNTPAPELISAAGSVASNSPGYITANYHRARLLLGVGRASEARLLLDKIIAGLGRDAATAPTRNALLAERIQTARNLNEFLSDAPRAIVTSGSYAAEMAQCQIGPATATGGCTGKLPELQFDDDGAAYINTQIPLAVLEEAAESPKLPPHLRQGIGDVAWVRALGLGKPVAVKRMAKLLPSRVRSTAGESDGFAATLALLRAPGMRPFLDSGVQRSASFDNMDHWRDNWWCGRWTDGAARPGTETYSGYRPQPASVPPLGFLSAEQRKDAASEAARLNELPEGLVWIGKRAIAYIRTHPNDPRAAETLALIVQGTRWGCGAGDGSEQRAISKEAFELLHSRYPNTEWAKKTKYYY